MEEKIIPDHVAIILDGNRRWARKRGLPPEAGHAAGAKNVEKICKVADKLGISYLTFYAFSTENQKRSEHEVKKLMDILRDYMKTAIKKANKNNMAVRVIGQRDYLDKDLVESIAELEKVSQKNTGLTMIMAINYGGRDEITRAINRILDDEKSGTLKEEPVTEEIISSYLDTKGIPDPELLIRTSGEMRLSNFLLWQCAYSEFYFTDIPWPSFGEKDLIDAVGEYSKRNRRFGKG